MVSKVWFITGTSKGFGRIWAEAALTRAEYARRIEPWEKWNDVSVEAQGDWPAKQTR